MNPEVQGTFVCEKVNKIRWIPEEYGETKTFITGSWDNSENHIKTWSFETMLDEEEADYPRAANSLNVSGDVTELKFIDRQTFAASTSAGDVFTLGIDVYDRTTPFQKKQSWDALHKFSNGEPCPCTAFTAFEGDIASVGEDGAINFVNCRQEQIVRTIKNADSCTLHSVCFLKHNEVVTGSLSGLMKIWDFRSPNDAPVSSFLLSGEQQCAMCIIHHPTQHHLILAGGESGSLAVWDLRVNTYPASLMKAHSSAILEMQFHPDHPQRLFTCSDGGEIWHWNTASMSKFPSVSGSHSGEDFAMNPWLLTDDDKSNMEVESLMPVLPLPINTLDCNKDKVLCGCDNEAIFLIKNLVL